MKTLIIDTSSKYCLLALTQDDRIVQQMLFPHENRLSESLLPSIRALCALNTIERIAVGVGPGSYTGTRIGVTVARSLSYGLQIPLRGFCSLMAFLPLSDGRLAAVLPAKSGRCFFVSATKVEKKLHIDRAELLSADALQAALQNIDFTCFCDCEPCPENIVQSLQMPSVFAFETDAQLIYLNEHI